MKKLFTPFAFFLLVASVSSCAKCVVCVDKTSSTYSKEEFCDKDFDKGDVDQAIEYAEDNGYTCHAKSRII